MKSQWDIIGWLNLNVPKYMYAAVKTATTDPNKPSWLVPTDSGAIIVPNTKLFPEYAGGADSSKVRKPPLGIVYDVATAPTWLIGGPTPLSLGLLGAVYGGLIGRGLGTLLLASGLTDAEEEHFLRVATILGALGGMSPGALIGIQRTFNAPDLRTALASWVKRWPKKTAQVGWGLAAQPVYEPQWRDMILGDPYLSSREKALAAGPPYAAAIASGTSIITPMDVAAVSANTVLGAAFGRVLGNLASLVLGESPRTREMMQQSGMFAGLVKGLVGRIR